MYPDSSPRERAFSDALDELTLPTEGGESDIIDQVQRAIALGSLPGISEGTVFAGRYVLERKLGEGGMGVVWLARDRELDRGVAVKMLTGVGDRASLSRMRREARAVALIAHPNVAAVFDVDVDARPPFIVMEYVEGGDLRAWLRREPRPGWKAIVEMFEQAGAGLAAAHREGLVHRDFKPGNVLVGDGRVRVADFGLARPSARGERGPSTEICGTVDATLTGSGVALGTPSYMAPEQHKAGPVTPAADIFAFACSLYEGLYGQRAFPGADGSELARSKAHGPPPEPPNSNVPSRVYSVVARGLAADPEERWPSMQDFVAALRRVHHRGRVARLTVLVAGAVATGLFALMWPATVVPNECATELESFEVESDAQQHALAAALRQTSSSSALREVAVESLSDFREQWVAAWLASCGGSLPRDRSDAGVACLRNVRRSASDQLERGAEAPESAERLAKRLHLFPTVAECTDLATARLQPLPSDPDLRLEIETLQSWARSEPERRDNAEEGIAMIGRARKTGHNPTLATVQLAVALDAYRNGDVETASVQCGDAYSAAIEGGADWIAYRAAQRCTVVSSVLGKVDDARRWDSSAAAIQASIGADLDELVETRSFLASALARAGALQEARELSDELYRRILDAPEHPQALIFALGEIAQVSIWLDDFDLAVERLEEALRRARLYYAHDPGVLGSVEGKLATAYRYVERYEEAEALYEKALARPLQPAARLITLLNYSQMLGDQPERLRDARALLDTARKDLEAAGRQGSMDFANLLAAVGQIEFKANRSEEARVALEQAREIYAEQLGPEHIRIQNVDQWLAKLAAAR